MMRSRKLGIDIHMTTLDFEAHLFCEEEISYILYLGMVPAISQWLENELHPFKTSRVQGQSQPFKTWVLTE